MITIAYIEQIFRRRGWHYQLDNDGDILTYWDSVPIYITTDSQVGVTLFTRVHTFGSARVANARIHDVSTFMDAINGILREGAFDFTSDRLTTFFVTAAHLTGGSYDDQPLSVAIERIVSVVKAFGPLIIGIMEGQLTLQQALNIVRSALSDGGQGGSNVA